VSLLVRLWVWLFYRTGWLIGPFVDGVRYSKGLPWRPKPTATGWTITLGPGDEVDYATRDCHALSDIRLRYRATGTFASSEDVHPPCLTVFFQRRGDDWSGTGEFEFYRWYSAAFFPLEGEHEVSVPLVADQWIGVMGRSDPQAFAAAVADPARFGVCFGSTYLRGHGVTGAGTIEMFQ
jgi:hypothetical protein